MTGGILLLPAVDISPAPRFTAGVFLSHAVLHKRSAWTNFYIGVIIITNIFMKRGVRMREIDSFPTDRVGNLEYCVGHALPFGAILRDGGVNFSVFSKEATGCTLVLYRTGEAEPFQEIPFPEAFRIGNEIGRAHV